MRYVPPVDLSGQFRLLSMNSRVLLISGHRRTIRSALPKPGAASSRSFLWSRSSAFFRKFTGRAKTAFNSAAGAWQFVAGTYLESVEFLEMSGQPFGFGIGDLREGWAQPGDLVANRLLREPLHFHQEGISGDSQSVVLDGDEGSTTSCSYLSHGITIKRESAECCRSTPARKPKRRVDGVRVNCHEGKAGKRRRRTTARRRPDSRGGPSITTAPDSAGWSADSRRIAVFPAPGGAWTSANWDPPRPAAIGPMSASRANSALRPMKGVGGADGA